MTALKSFPMQHSGQELASVKNYKVIDCIECGFVHIIPIPSDKELFDMYSKEFYEKMKPEYIKKDESELEYWNLEFDEKLEVINNIVPMKRILDVGCGAGFFLMRAKARGWDVLGVEPSGMAAEYAKSHGISTVQDLFQNLDYSKLGRFGAIHMKFFLEHTSSPRAVLENCHHLLEEGGVIIIEVPNDYNPLQHVVISALGKHEYWLAPPEHINYFNFDSLENLLRKHQFKILRRESTFPLELFLLMGHDYIGNDPVGRTKHAERMKMELNLYRGGQKSLKRKIYSYLAELGLGREAIVYAQKYSSKL